MMNFPNLNGERMKCPACQYENRRGEWKNIDAVERYGSVSEKEEFVEVVGNFQVQGEPDYYSDGVESVKLFACPKCKVVQMKKDW